MLLCLHRGYWVVFHIQVYLPCAFELKVDKWVDELMQCVHLCHYGGNLDIRFPQSKGITLTNCLLLVLLTGRQRCWFGCRCKLLANALIFYHRVIFMNFSKFALWNFIIGWGRGWIWNRGRCRCWLRQWEEAWIRCEVWIWCGRGRGKATCTVSTFSPASMLYPDH